MFTCLLKRYRHTTSNLARCSVTAIHLLMVMTAGMMRLLLMMMMVAGGDLVMMLRR